MKRNPKLYLGDIVESIDDINGYINTFTEDDFFQDTQAQDAVIRRLEIIGEAVKNLDEESSYDHFYSWLHQFFL